MDKVSKFKNFENMFKHILKDFHITNYVKKKLVKKKKSVQKMKFQKRLKQLRNIL